MKTFGQGTDMPDRKFSFAADYFRNRFFRTYFRQIGRCESVFLKRKTS